MKHAMVDLECLGAGDNACIVSIGAVDFIPERFSEAGDPFMLNVAIQSGLNAGATVSGKTLEWWLEQSDAARKGLFSPPPIPEREALAAFRRWLAEREVEFVWGHGVNYDLRILAQAYARHNQQVPWLWRNERDTRTIFDASGITAEDWERASKRVVSEKHIAWADAVRQALAVQIAYERLGIDFHAVAGTWKS